MSTTETSCPRCEDADVLVEYEISGRFIPASFSGPAEYPEIEIVNVESDGCSCWTPLIGLTGDEHDGFMESIVEQEQSEQEPSEEDLWAARGWD
jgi:hypothetical protein